MNSIINNLLQHRWVFLYYFFIIFTIHYAVLYYIDFIPEITRDNEAILNTVIALGLLAGLVQFIGYALYWQLSIKNEIDPNPLTWLMFAYGTALLTVLEWDNSAVWYELVLPTVCSICAIGIALLIWVRSKEWWPAVWTISKNTDGAAFKWDMIITVAYVIVAYLSMLAFFESSTREILVLMFLVIANLTTFTSFVPILRETYKFPEHEDWRPWALWTISYSLLFVTSFVVGFIGDGKVMMPDSWNITTWSISFWMWLTILSYPATNAPLHALVGWFARPARLQ